MAVLAVIGGIDGRLRLGGQVAHEEFGEGTVTRITPKGRITVQFSDMRACRVCPLSQLKPVGAPRVPAVERGFMLARALASGLRAAVRDAFPRPSPQKASAASSPALRGASGAPTGRATSSSPVAASRGGEDSSPRSLPVGSAF